MSSDGRFLTIRSRGPAVREAWTHDLPPHSLVTLGLGVGTIRCLSRSREGSCFIDIDPSDGRELRSRAAPRELIRASFASDGAVLGQEKRPADNGARRCLVFIDPEGEVVARHEGFRQPTDVVDAGSHWLVATVDGLFLIGKDGQGEWCWRPGTGHSSSNIALADNLLLAACSGALFALHRNGDEMWRWDLPATGDMVELTGSEWNRQLREQIDQLQEIAQRMAERGVLPEHEEREGVEYGNLDDLFVSEDDLGSKVQTDSHVAIIGPGKSIASVVSGSQAISVADSEGSIWYVDLHGRLSQGGPAAAEQAPLRLLATSSGRVLGGLAEHELVLLSGRQVGARVGLSEWFFDGGAFGALCFVRNADRLLAFDAEGSQQLDASGRFLWHVTSGNTCIVSVAGGLAALRADS